MGVVCIKLFDLVCDECGGRLRVEAPNENCLELPGRWARMLLVEHDCGNTHYTRLTQGLCCPWPLCREKLEKKGWRQRAKV